MADIEAERAALKRMGDRAFARRIYHDVYGRIAIKRWDAMELALYGSNRDIVMAMSGRIMAAWVFGFEENKAW